MDSQPDNNIIGNNIKALRLFYGLTQQDVSLDLDWGMSTVSSYERGRTTPDIDHMKKLADYFFVPLSILSEF